MTMPSTKPFSYRNPVNEAAAPTPRKKPRLPAMRTNPEVLEAMAMAVRYAENSLGYIDVEIQDSHYHNEPNGVVTVVLLSAITNPGYEKRKVRAGPRGGMVAEKAHRHTWGVLIENKTVKTDNIFPVQYWKAKQSNVLTYFE